jgi:hypothetical protein
MKIQIEQIITFNIPIRNYLVPQKFGIVPKNVILCPLLTTYDHFIYFET